MEPRCCIKGRDFTKAGGEMLYCVPDNPVVSTGLVYLGHYKDANI